MTMSYLVALVLLALVGLSLLGFAIWRRGRGAAAPPRSATPAGAAAGADQRSAVAAPDNKLAELDQAVYQLAFGSADLPGELRGEHAAIVKEVSQALTKAVSDSQYFPRRPQVVPKLMRAVRNDATTNEELVAIILQDPVLSSDTLRMANSTYYRLSSEHVGNISQAVVLLGIEGLKSLIAASVLRPVFQVPEGYFEDFGDVIWEQAFNSAWAAQILARRGRRCDGFTAHLLGLLFCISSIVLFRLTVDRYQRRDGLEPAPQAFVRVLEDQLGEATLLLVAEWQLGEPLAAAVREYLQAPAVDKMAPLTQALYYGRIAGTAALLYRRGSWSQEQAQELLESQGLDPETVSVVWEALTAPDADERLDVGLYAEY